MRPGAAVPLPSEQAVARDQQGRAPTVAMLRALVEEHTRRRADNEARKGTLNAARAGQPSAPSGSIPPSAKPHTARGRRRRRPGRKTGPPGVPRARPARIDAVNSPPPLADCPRCHPPLPHRPSEIRERSIEGLVAHKSNATLPQIPRPYCGRCEKRGAPAVLAAMAHDRICLSTSVRTAWLPYRCGLSPANLVARLAPSGLESAPGALTQGWQRLGTLRSPADDQLLARVKRALVRLADETGGRIPGVTPGRWDFGCTSWSSSLIDRPRGTAVVHQGIGTVFAGVWRVDVWGASHAIDTWATQRGIFPRVTALNKVDLQRPHDAVWRDFRQRGTRLFNDAVRVLHNDEGCGPPTRDRRRPWRADRLAALVVVPRDHPEGRRIQKRLRRHRDERFPFLDYGPLVSPYHTPAEPQMRGPVRCRRVSQGNRSRAGADAHAMRMRLVRSRDLHGRTPVADVRRLAQTAIAGTPLVLPLDPDDADQLAA